MKIVLKNLFRIILISVIVITSYVAQAKKNDKEFKKEPTPVKIEVLKEHNFYESIRLFGKCEIDGSVSYISGVSGIVDYISAKQGDSINQGEVILTIDSKLAEAIKSEANATLALAEYSHLTNIKLYEENRLSKEKFINSELAFEQAKLNYCKSIRKYNDMVIKASHIGILGLVKKRIKEQVREGDILFEIVCDGEKSLLIELPEFFLTSGIVKQSIEVSTTNSKDEKIIGKISAIANYVSDHGTIDMRVFFPKEISIPHGTFVEVQIVYNKHNALGISEKTILKNNIGHFIYTVDKNNRVKQLYITLGTRTGEIIEIIGSVKSNMLIISEGLTKVNDGDEVKILNNN